MSDSKHSSFMVKPPAAAVKNDISVEKAAPKATNTGEASWRTPSRKGRSWKKWIFGAVIVLVVLFVGYGGVFAWQEYTNRWDRTYGETWWFKASAAVYPVPVAIADYRPVWLKDFLEQRDIVTTFVRAQVKSTGVPFNREQFAAQLPGIEQQIIDKLIEDGIVAKGMREKNVSVSKEEIDKAFANEAFTDATTEQDKADAIKDTYGLTMDEFKRLVIRPSLERQKLADAKKSDINYTDLTNKKIAAVKERLDKGDAFADIAKDLSEDAYSNQNGGDLGWVKAGDTPYPDFEKAAFAVEKGKVSNLIDSDLGHHFVFMQDMRTTAGKKEYHLSHILIGDADFAYWLRLQRQDLRTNRFIK